DQPHPHSPSRTPTLCVWPTVAGRPPVARALNKVANSSGALGWVFAFTGLLGFSLGPILGMYLQSASGTMAIVHALGTTGAIFLTLSGYALVSKKDFSFLAGFLSVGLWVLIGALLFSFISALFFGVQITGLQLAVSSMAVIIFSGFILYDTHRILSGGETNYVLATVSLYLSIYNLFIHLLALFGFADD
ncbi:MAG: Bax inhibitor-1 family protein, partial [Pseudomonadales bacterium]